MNTKFTLLFLAAFTIAVVSNAQINKGSTALGGNLSFNGNSSINMVMQKRTSTILFNFAFY